MNDDIRLRSANPSDARAIAAVHISSWQTTYPGIVDQAYIDSLAIDERTAVWERRLRGESRGQSDTIVAESTAGSVVGFLSGGQIREPEPGFDAELHAIYLEQSAQGLGIGRHLSREWAGIAIGRGYRAAVVRVLALNPARLFYERLGARRIRDAELAIGGKPYPEIWYGWDDLHILAS